MRKLIPLILVFFSAAVYCQSIDSLSSLIKDIQRGENDSIRFSANEKFTDGFEKLLLEEGSFSKNFDSLKNVSVQSSDDNKIHIYTWVVSHVDGLDYKYFGFLQIHSESSDTLILLNDSTDVIKKPESEKLRPDRWLGAIYYNIIPVIKSGKTYYTLLGWKAKDYRMTQKIIDVLYIDGKQPRFGFPIFKSGSVYKNRVVFTFNAQASMTLHYDKDYDGIVLDHITLTKNNPSSLAGPDGTYDAFKVKKGKWILFRDVDVGTKLEPAKDLPVPPGEK